MVVPVVPTVGKQVFLRLVTAITTVMPRMTPAVTMVKKAAVGGKKSPAGAGTKTAACEKPLPSPPKAPPRPSPRGGSPFLLCFRRFGGTSSLWGGLGRGPSLDSRPLGRVGEGLQFERPPFGEGWGGAYTRGGSPFLLCFRWLCGTPSLWGGLGRGSWWVGEGLLAGRVLP